MARVGTLFVVLPNGDLLSIDQQLIWTSVVAANNVGLNCYFLHEKSYWDYDIGYLPLKPPPSLQEVEGAPLCSFTMVEV